MHKRFFYETKHKQFKDRSNSVAVAQRDFLNDPSIHIVNRKSLCMNKPQIFYNDDSLNLMCVALTANSLKWSEGFLGDGMMYDFGCKYEEPLRSRAMDFDIPKIAIFDLGRGHYSYSPPSSLPRKRLSFSPPDTDSGEPLSKMAYDYRFVNDEIRGLLVGKKKVCLEGLFIKELPASVTEDPPRSYHPPRVYEWANSKKDENDVGWLDIMSDIWHSSANCPMEMVNGEVMSLNGLFNSCFGVEPNVERRHVTMGRMHNQFDFHQRIGCAYVERNQCLPHHAIKMPIIHFNTINEPFMFPIPGNLNGAYFSYCPEMVMRDVIRMWTELDENLLGISLTTPMFSDGFIDYNPSLIGPKFSLFEELLQLDCMMIGITDVILALYTYPPSFADTIDWLSLCFLPVKFCLDHYSSMGKDKKADYEGKTKYMRSHCMPQPDRLNSLSMKDELFSKVPRTNAAMRNSLKSCNTLQCLTLFQDSMIGRQHTIDFDRHLSTLRIIHDEGVSNWTDFYFDSFSSRMNNVILSTEKNLKCVENKESLMNFYVVFLFCSECSISDGFV